MSNGLGICERCGEKPAEIILKIGMHVRQDGRTAYAPDRRLCPACGESSTGRSRNMR
jgi:ribosomal protein L37E